MTMKQRLGLCLLAILLCLSSWSGFGDGGGEERPWTSAAVPGTLTLSILGDSISTFGGISNGTAADSTNSTIRFFDVYYREGTFGMKLADTWWSLTADALGLELLVNNSWSGSYVFSNRDLASAGCGERCVQLHDDTGENAGQEPDIIAVYLGTNDLLGAPDTLGTAEEIDHAALATELPDGTFSYREPATMAEAYAIMLHRITHRYPNAQVYCFTIPRLAVERSDPERINWIIRAVALRYGAVVVDLYNDSAITGDLNELARFYGDGQIHPGALGMTAIADCFTESLRKNLRF